MQIGQRANKRSNRESWREGKEMKIAGSYNDKADEVNLLANDFYQKERTQVFLS